MTGRFSPALAVLLFSVHIAGASAAECRYRAPNGAVPGTLVAASTPPCTPAANTRPLIGKPPTADAARPRERNNTTIHIGGSVSADTRVGR